MQKQIIRKYQVCRVERPPRPLVARLRAALAVLIHAHA